MQAQILERINIKYILIFVLFVVLFLNFFLLKVAFEKSSGILEVTFLDVGQGDAVLVKTPSSKKVLIDAGPNSSALLKALSRELYFWERDFDLVLASHADKDHIGGFVDFFKYYRADKVYDSSLFDEKDSKISSLLKSLSSYKNPQSKSVLLKRGDIIDFGDGVYIAVFFPGQIRPKGSNESSLALKIVYGQTAFFLSGDLPQEEERILTFLDREKLKSDVLKLGHHGSKTSSAEEFLRFVKPDYAVVSAGKGNSYGHPHKEVKELMQLIGAKILYTWDGNVSFVSDGNRVFLSK